MGLGGKIGVGHDLRPIAALCSAAYVCVCGEQEGREKGELHTYG